MSAARLRIHHFLPASQANGPGWRAVLWLQGCTLGCPGCFNPGTHANSGGEWIEVEELCRQVFPRLLGEGRVRALSSGNAKTAKAKSPHPTLSQKAREENSTPIEGITLSGGEPLQQMAGLISFLTRIRAETHLSVILFSGYTWTEIQMMPQAARLLSLVDVLLAGRYVAEQRVARGLLGSGNKTIHFLSDRYTATDLESVPEAEVILTQNGEIIYSGINPLQDQDSPSGGGPTGS